MAFVCMMTIGCVYTAPFTDAECRTVPHSIATMERIALGGLPQSIWFRGVSDSNPALILLHGGPGASEAPLFRHFNAALEQQYVVVYWEQRGAGRSFSSDIPQESMTVERFVRDLDELVDLVRKRFGHKKVVLLGHSWGTVLGTFYAARYPEKVALYVGVAQIANMPLGRRPAYDFTFSEALKRRNSEVRNALQQIGPPPYASVDELLAVEGWTQQFGGVNHAQLSTGTLIWAALTTDEANLIDLIKFGQGNRFSLTHLEPELSRLDLTERYRPFAVPIVFLLGHYDRHIPSELAEQYFNMIEAPCKRLLWFDQSGHNPPFEEPERFTAIMIKDVLPLAADGCAQ